MKNCFFLIALLLGGFNGFGQTKSEKSITAAEPLIQWKTQPGGKKSEEILMVNLKNSLNERQKKAINSGFSTFSQLQVFSEDNATTPLAQLICTVKYDTWEEKYQVSLILDKPTQAVVSSFEDYSKSCLIVEVEKPSDASFKWPKNLKAKLRVEQISTEQAQKIRSWIVKQQSGVMQGLFSHMLGEMTLSDSIELEIKVP